jgi:hypothetical protein
MIELVKISGGGEGKPIKLNVVGANYGQSARVSSDLANVKALGEKP